MDMEKLLKWPPLVSLFNNDQKQFRIMKKLQSNNFVPAKDLIFEVFNMPPEDVRVVFINQGPITMDGIARGLAFAANDGCPVQTIRTQMPALKNIVDAIAVETGEIGLDIENSGSKPFDYTLQHFVDQGVFLLNVQLTATPYFHEGVTAFMNPDSHTSVWEEVLMNELFEYLNKLEQPVIFVFFGEKAERYKGFITNFYHTVISCPHPLSPIYDTKTKDYATFGRSKIFTTINKELVKNSSTPINWLFYEKEKEDNEEERKESV